jgi:hypothetical protein
MVRLPVTLWLTVCSGSDLMIRAVEHIWAMTGIVIPVPETLPRWQPALPSGCGGAGSGPRRDLTHDKPSGIRDITVCQPQPAGGWKVARDIKSTTHPEAIYAISCQSKHPYRGRECFLIVLKVEQTVRSDRHCERRLRVY